MIDLTTINEWQRMDPVLQIPQPWYTFPALDEINTWDLSDKTVLEIGGGASTVWWNRKAKEVRTIETNEKYMHELKAMGFDVLPALPNPINYYDIAIVDNDGDRDGNITNAFIAVKAGGILIIDNWMQPSVDWFPSQDVRDFINEFNHKIFKQPGHQDWQTLIVYL